MFGENLGWINLGIGQRFKQELENLMKNTAKFGLIAALLIGGASFTYAQDEAENVEAVEAEATQDVAEEGAEMEEQVNAEVEAADEQAAEPAETAEAEPAAEPVPATSEELETVVATVDGMKITLGEVLIVKSETPPQFLQGTDEEIMTNLVEQIAVQRILSEQAQETQVLELRINNLTHSARAQEALQAYVDENLTDEYVQEKYDEVIGSQPDQTEWQASHILVSSEEEAKAAKERIDGGEEFATVAEELSSDPGSAANGGDLGWFGPGQMVPPFEEAVGSLEKGEVSEPVQTDFGWHIISLSDSRIASKPSFEEVEPQLRDYAQSQLVNQYIEETKQNAEVEPAEDVDATLIERVLPE